MGEALRGAAGDGGGGRSPGARRLIRRLATAGALLLALAAPRLPLDAQPAPVAPAPLPWIGAPPEGGRTAAMVRIDAGRLVAFAEPGDAPLARSLLERAARHDSFPGLPRPQARAHILIAPDDASFRRWTGPSAPHWGAAVALPGLQRVVLRGGRAAAAAGDPHVVLRHELAHLALHEAMGELPPRWFDEGYASYAAGEWGRDELLVANLALLYRRMPGLDDLDRRLVRGEREAASAYALSHRAVAELAALDPERGLTLFFGYWREAERLDPAVRRAYGITLDGFEKHWQQRTRRRYGILALLGEMTLGAGFALLVVLPLYVLRRRRDRLRWAELRAADARAAAASAAAAAGEAPASPWWAPDAEPEDEPAKAAADAAGGPAGAAGERGGDAEGEGAAGPAKGAQPFA